MKVALMDFAYLAAAVLFITGLKWLSAPATARKGNFLSSFGMLLAILVTLFDKHILSYWGILAGVVVGGSLGAWAARTVKMTAMPQMVAILNGFGGLASLLVSAGEWHRLALSDFPFPTNVAISIYASSIIGAVTFSGSLVAAGKLQEIISGRPVLFKGQHILNAVLFLACLGLATYLTMHTANPYAFLALNILALVLGVLLVIPIGGADMPVVICLLNSYSGIAAATTGFIINNHGLIITGALVGASGIILTQIMCKAMNRSLANVLFGGFGAASTTGGPAGTAAKGTVRQINAEDAAASLAYAESVAFVPGYGLAVAQAQHVARELGELLEKRGVKVTYGIHPVAGRMPGHMNVLLAEANVPYDKLLDMEVINPHFERTDVVVVVGANDVVNPAARNDPSSPLYGMPILDVDKARQIIFMKRSLNPGFAGIDNELFYNEKTSMLFGDAAKMLAALVTEVKQV
ncbi:MAG: NAD(P)(+) transhydrogenase (Re/Si-specific) subunit beta [Verrucomicrobia bacterium]|nr:NAD(P)(+) transhydrogenase (Re/Si-specific) subunit beta [Verrucomicrobiota bacterium]